jgi:hypothetical protein
MSEFLAWHNKLMRAIERQIDANTRNGITAMSVDNLRQLVKPPAGGPTGFLAQWQYENDWFPCACNSLAGKYRSRIYH